MNEPQIWTLIGVFAASMVGIIGLVLRTMTTQFASIARQFESMNRQFDYLRSELKGEISSLREETKSEISSLRGETAARFESLGTQIAHLDRDTQALSKRVFPE